MKTLVSFALSFLLTLPAVAEQWSQAGTEVLGERISFFTHNSTKWDFEGDGAIGANKLIQWSVAKGLPIVAMKHTLESDGGYYLERTPDFTFLSNSGELSGLVPQVREAYFAGAYLEACLSATAHEVLRQMSVNVDSDLRMIFVIDGIRGGEYELVQDPTAKNAIDEYFKMGTPDAYYSPLNLKKVLDIVKDRKVIESFLIRAIQKNVIELDLDSVSHRVVVAYNGEVIGEIQKGRVLNGEEPHTLTIDFVSSDRLK